MNDWENIMPSAVWEPGIIIESTPPYPGDFVREFLGSFVGPEATENQTFPKPGSNRLGGDSRGGSKNAAPSGARLPKRGQRPLQTLARAESGPSGPKKATPVADSLGNGGEA